MRVLSGFAVLLTLAACGGGGGTLTASTAPTGPQALLDNIADANRIGQLILVNNGSNQAALTAEGATPVTFNGVMILDEAANAPSGAYYGDMTAIVNFNASTLNGSANNFVYFDDSGPST
ncbi:MAG: hypothetical protein KJO42_16380, partial [Silicimonas sp.]|nr:hypothetical protein [Silicimonas sp.]